MAASYLTPFVIPGYEPPAPDPQTGEVRIKTTDERRDIIWQMKQVRMVQEGMESPVAKAAISGAMGASTRASGLSSRARHLARARFTAQGRRADSPSLARARQDSPSAPSSPSWARPSQSKIRSSARSMTA